MKKVAILMGSDSDLPVVKKAADTLSSFGVPYERHVYSAHRTPEQVRDFVSSAADNGFGVMIAAAGMAAHLAGAVAANTTLPVIGIPIKSQNLGGMEALLSTVQMPSGIPVATVAIDGAVNSALLAIEILSLGEPELEKKLAEVTSVTKLLDDGNTPEQILEILLGDMGLEIMDTMPTQYYCNCDKERVEKAVVSIGRQEINEMIQEGKPIEVKCHFCNTAYKFTVEELKALNNVKGIILNGGENRVVDGVAIDVRCEATTSHSILISPLRCTVVYQLLELAHSWEPTWSAHVVASHVVSVAYGDVARKSGTCGLCIYRVAEVVAGAFCMAFDVTP